MTEQKADIDPMVTLSRMALDIRFEDIPSDVIDCAKRTILDTIAVTIAGSGLEGIREVVELVQEKGGRPDSPIPFYGGRVPASEAAFAIGPMARATDLGMLHEEAGHCAEYILPTMLAAMGLREKVTGEEFLTAFVIGQETLIRIGIAFRAVSSGLYVGRGYGHTIFGCVAAVGRLLGLSLDQLLNAQGIARAMTQPHDTAMYSDASLIVRVHHGFIAQDAINACLLAQRGITGPQKEVVSGPRGYLAFAHWETDPAAITRGLGDRWEMSDVIMKLYATCSLSQTAITGIVDQMRQHEFGGGDIASIEIDESPMSWRVVAQPREIKWNPQTVPECQFSLPYVVAVAAFEGTVFLDSYTPEMMARKDVRDLMKRISVTENKKIQPFGARLTTTLHSGQQVTGEYLYARGHHRNPFTDEELLDKHRRCAAHSVMPLAGDVVNSIAAAALDLDRIDDVSKALLDPMAPAADPAGPQAAIRKEQHVLR
jgi:2-methylcitrate dehydratase PrpD